MFEPVGELSFWLSVVQLPTKGCVLSGSFWFFCRCKRTYEAEFYESTDIPRQRVGHTTQPRVSCPYSNPHSCQRSAISLLLR